MAHAMKLSASPEPFEARKRVARRLACAWPVHRRAAGIGFGRRGTAPRPPGSRRRARAAYAYRPRQQGKQGQELEQSNWQHGHNGKLRLSWRSHVRYWQRKPYYGDFIGGVVLGTILGVGVVGVAPPPPGPQFCWYWADPSMTRGYWDYCY